MNVDREEEKIFQSSEILVVPQCPLKNSEYSTVRTVSGNAILKTLIYPTSSKTTELSELFFLLEYRVSTEYNKASYGTLIEVTDAVSLNITSGFTVMHC